MPIRRLCKSSLLSGLTNNHRYEVPVLTRSTPVPCITSKMAVAPGMTSKVTRLETFVPVWFGLLCRPASAPLQVPPMIQMVAPSVTAGSW